MTERLLTPTKITAWLDCPHYLTLAHRSEGKAKKASAPGRPFGSFARLLQEKGLLHEQQVLAVYEGDGEQVLVVDEATGELFADWAKRSLPALTSDATVIYQMPFVHDGVRGVADFLERQEDADGNVVWEPVDAKLARSAAKPGHVLQLCFYAEAIAAETGRAPATLKVSLGSGRTDPVGYEDVRPYWSRLRHELQQVMDAEPTGETTRPERCDHCGFCEFEETCEATWRAEDSLTFVAGIRKTEQRALEASGVSTLAGLASRAEPVDDLRPERLVQLRVQARLQLEAREQPHEPPPHRLIEAGDDPVWGHGLETLPEPHPADVFLDFEGHPFWRPDRGLFFLFGYVTRHDTSDLRYHAIWAHDPEDEREAVRELVEYLTHRRAANPGMHVYHYNHTERSALQALTAEHAVAESALDALVQAGVFVDLLTVTRHSLQAGLEGYGLKHVERLTGYERGHEIDKGAGAVVAYEQYMANGDGAHLYAIAAYNEDDVRSTAALREWLVSLRPSDMPWRDDAEVEPEHPDVDELIEALSAYPDGSEQRLMADLLGYWIRESNAYLAPLRAQLDEDTSALVASNSALAGLTNPTQVKLLTPTGRKKKWPGLRLSFPEQALSREFDSDLFDKAIFSAGDGALRYVDVHRIDPDARVVDLVWTQTHQDEGQLPSALVPNTSVSNRPKVTVLDRLAGELLGRDGFGPPNPATVALLRQEPPRFVAGGGPPDGRFSDDIDDLAAWVVQLDGGVLGVQGPPGTGKTYRAAHMAKALVRVGKRVGVMAMSHHGIHNAMAEIARVFAAGDPLELRSAQKVTRLPSVRTPGVTYVTDNKRLGSGEFDVIAGTAWAFASTSVQAAPVDVLLVDEAGQLALVDAVVASTAAKSVVLLGDPQQLPHVAQAKHPGVSGRSALGHLLDERDTMPSDRGVFIEESRRMHPDICRFVSERIYEGRLQSFGPCARQTTEGGTGLRWLRAEHTGCSTESGVEAEMVATEICSLLGRGWTDQTGQVRALDPGDFMVVAPYNDQVRLLRARFDADPALSRVPVGTVDKFQGRQAPVVFFTMTSSSAGDMPRGTEFLFSKNRLNVAVSRAQCLAYLVCTDTLLSSRAKTVDDMLLIATLCSFVEYSQGCR